MPADAQRFVKDAVDFVVAGLRLLGQLPAPLTDGLRRQGEERNDGEGDGGEYPVHPIHRDERHSQRDNVTQDGCQRVRDCHLYAVDIAGHARDDVPLII